MREINKKMKKIIKVDKKVNREIIEIIEGQKERRGEGTQRLQ